MKEWLVGCSASQGNARITILAFQQITSTVVRCQIICTIAWAICSKMVGFAAFVSFDNLLLLPVPANGRTL
jgi:hypothetical protein